MTDNQLDKAVREWMEELGMELVDTGLYDIHDNYVKNYYKTKSKSPKVFNANLSIGFVKQLYLDREQYAKEQAEIAALEGKIWGVKQTIVGFLSDDEKQLIETLEQQLASAKRRAS